MITPDSSHVGRAVVAINKWGRPLKGSILMLVPPPVGHEIKEVVVQFSDIFGGGISRVIACKDLEFLSSFLHGNTVTEIITKRPDPKDPSRTITTTQEAEVVGFIAAPDTDYPDDWQFFYEGDADPDDYEIVRPVYAPVADDSTTNKETP